MLKAAVVYLLPVASHLFWGRSCRLARCIGDFMMAWESGEQYFCSLSGHIRHERKDYYAILETTRKRNMDITPWLFWFGKLWEEEAPATGGFSLKREPRICPQCFDVLRIAGKAI